MGTTVNVASSAAFAQGTKVFSLVTDSTQVINIRAAQDCSAQRPTSHYLALYAGYKHAPSDMHATIFRHFGRFAVTPLSRILTTTGSLLCVSAPCQPLTGLFGYSRHYKSPLSFLAVAVEKSTPAGPSFYSQTLITKGIYPSLLTLESKLLATFVVAKQYSLR
jgi:hypothetical protein